MEASSTGSKQESRKTDYQLLLIAGLKKEIEMAHKLDPEQLAAEIRRIGFYCQRWKMLSAGFRGQQGSGNSFRDRENSRAYRSVKIRGCRTIYT